MDEAPRTPEALLEIGGALRLRVAAGSDRGRQRPHNEDRLVLGRFGRFEGRGGPSDGIVLGVCDGMGGALAGEVASALASETIVSEMRCAAARSRSAVARSLLESVERASQRVLERSMLDPATRGMGTTATACAMIDRELFVAQVGDSRAYLARRGRLTQLTRDQTLAMLLVEKGQHPPEEAKSSEFGHVILQALGTQERVEVDLRSVDVRDGDVLLVCSDGLSGVVPDDELLAALAADPRVAVATLIARANELGGPDNVSCIVARVEGVAMAPDDDAPVVARRVTLEPPPADASLLGTDAAPAPGDSDAQVDTGSDTAASAGVLGRLMARWRARPAR
jgi:protein phosphatase